MVTSCGSARPFVTDFEAMAPNMRLKLTARGGRLVRMGSILIAATAGRSVRAIR